MWSWHMHDWGMGWGGVILGPLLMIAFLVLLVLLVLALARRFGEEGGGRRMHSRTGREILDERYARGEIDREEYLARRKDISGA